MKSDKLYLPFITLIAIVHQSFANVEYWRERTYLPEVESKLRWESGRITDDSSANNNRHRTSLSPSSSRANGDIVSSSASSLPIVSSNARRYSTFYDPPNESSIPSPLNSLRASPSSSSSSPSSSSSSPSPSARQPYIPDVESDSRALNDRFTNLPPSSASSNKESSSPIVLPHGTDLRLALPDASSRPRYLSSIDRSSNRRTVDDEDDTSFYNRGYSNSRTQQRPPQRMRTPYSTSDHLVDDDSRSPHHALADDASGRSDGSHSQSLPPVMSAPMTPRDNSEVTSVPPDAAEGTADRPVAYSSNARRYPHHFLSPQDSASLPNAPSAPRIIQYNNYAQPDGRQNRAPALANQGEVNFNLNQEEARQQEEERIRDHLRRQEEKRRENESRRQAEEAIRLADRKNRQKDEAERAAAEREEGERDAFERKREEERLRRQMEAEKRSQKPNNIRVPLVNDGREEAIDEDSFTSERGNAPAVASPSATAAPGRRNSLSSNRNRFNVNAENSARSVVMSTVATAATTVRSTDAIRGTSAPPTSTESSSTSSSFRPRPAGRPGGSRRFIGRKRVSDTSGQRTTLTTTTTTTTLAPDDYEEDYEDDYEDDRTTTTTTTIRPKRRRNGRRRNRYRDDQAPSTSTTPSTTTIRTTTTTLSPGYRERSDGRIIDFKADPNFPHELKGADLTDYPFYVKVPEDVNFNCEGRHDGYYASVQHHCQIYHHCAIGNRYDFLCPNYTLFDQTTFTCRFINTVNCGQSAKYYNRNNDLYVESTTEGTSGDSNKNNNGNSNKKESNKKFGSNSSNSKNSSNNSNLNNDDNNSNNDSGGSSSNGNGGNGHRSAR